MKYDIIIQGGQSNAEGFGGGDVIKEYIPNERILYLTDNRSIEPTEQGLLVKPPENIDCPFFISVADNHLCGDTVRGDFSLTFAQEYLRDGLLADDRKLLIIRSAVGGTGFKKGHWGKYDYLYMRMLAMIEYVFSVAPNSRVVAFLWHQGEHDAFEGNPPEEYRKQLTGLIEGVRSRYGKMPFICGDFVNEWKQLNIEQCAPIVETIKNVSNDIGNSAFVETKDLLSNNQMIGDGDNIHFCRQALQVLGRRYFEAFKNLKG